MHRYEARRGEVWRGEARAGERGGIVKSKGQGPVGELKRGEAPRRWARFGRGTSTHSFIVQPSVVNVRETLFGDISWSTASASAATSACLGEANCSSRSQL